MLLSTATNVYAGNTVAKKVYLGSTQVWPPVVPFTPTDLSGLAIWFDASQLSGVDNSALDPWPNLAPGGTASKMVGTPVPTISPVRLNGQKVVRFKTNEGRLRMAAATGVKWDYTLVYVGRMWGTNQGRVISSGYPPTNFLLGYWGGFEDIGFSATGSFFVPDARKSQTTNWRMYSSDAVASPEFGGTGYHPRLFNNGVLLSSGGRTDGYCEMGDAWWDAFQISGYDPTDVHESCDCEVAEVCLYNRKLSDAERQQVEAYLRAKWGLP